MRSLFLISSIFLLLLSSSISAASFSPSDQPASAINERRSLGRRGPEEGFPVGITCSGKSYKSKDIRSLMKDYCMKSKQGEHSIMHPGSKKEKIPNDWDIDATTHSAWRISRRSKGNS
ncbi:hypothetical protein K3495_g15262 [Podosphaera aphanis]|nr:hypothetical protein K3495_g15262 [Podosphaera aphanis]